MCRGITSGVNHLIGTLGTVIMKHLEVVEIDGMHVHFGISTVSNILNGNYFIPM